MKDLVLEYVDGGDLLDYILAKGGLGKIIIISPHRKCSKHHHRGGDHTLPDPSALPSSQSKLLSTIVVGDLTKFVNF